MKLHPEIIDLASEGYFYPNGSPLSSGTVKIFPVTAHQEELLANGNLLRRGLLEHTFLNEVVDGGVDFDTLLYCDRNSIILNLRALNYGAGSKVKVKCESCDVEYEQDITFAFRGIPFNFHGCERGVNRLRYTFPKCKKVVQFKLPTVNEHRIYEQHGWLTFAKYITLSVEGADNTDEFYDYALPASDSSAFRAYYEKHMPGYDNNIEIQCTSCRKSKKTKIEIDCSIFGVKPGSGQSIHSEIFDLCYHSNGTFTQDIVYNMPTRLRSFYIQKLIETKGAEEEARNTSPSSKGTNKIARPPTAKS